MSNNDHAPERPGNAVPLPRPATVLLVAFTVVVVLAVAFAYTVVQETAAPAPPAPAEEEAPAPPPRTTDFAVVNAHDHLYREQDLERYFKAAERTGVVKTLFVASSKFTLMGNKHAPSEGNVENSLEMLRLAKKYPDKIIPFVTLHPDDDDKIGLLEQYRADGAMGLKLYTAHGAFYDRSLLADEMLPVYAWCEANNFPICWHVNLTRYANEFTRVLLKYPKLRIIVPHFGQAYYRPGGKEMQTISKIMDMYPGVYTDTSFGTRKILVAGLESVSAKADVVKAFVEKYQDRILWGTDMVVTGNKEKTVEWQAAVLQACRDLLEKDVYYFSMAAADSPYSARGDANPDGKLRGLNLPDEVLKKIYETNIEDFFALVP